MRRLLMLALLAVVAVFTSAYRPFANVQTVCPKCPEKGDRLLMTDGKTLIGDIVAKNQDGYVVARFSELRFVQYQEVSKIGRAHV